MLTAFHVFDTGGAVLWQKRLDGNSKRNKDATDAKLSNAGKQSHAGKASLDRLIADVVMKPGCKNHCVGCVDSGDSTRSWYWRRDGEVVFAAEYLSLAKGGAAGRIEELTDAVALEFMSRFWSAPPASLAKPRGDFEPFGAIFDRLWAEWFERHNSPSVGRLKRKQRRFKRVESTAASQGLQGQPSLPTSGAATDAPTSDSKGPTLDRDSKEDQSSGGGSSIIIGGIMALLRGLGPSRDLSESDLAPVVARFRDMLIAKNVAVDVATALCSSVAKRLIGSRLPRSALSTVACLAAYETAVEQAIVDILTPKKAFDIVQNALSAKEAKSVPYTVVFVGVNGVGKTTTLAKVGSYLLTKSIRVGFAACDTFRSGAIEQLRTHACALGVPLFESGYGKQPHAAASEALVAARQAGVEVLLIDTAGRMTTNTNHMLSLAKLVDVNRPNTILFVGDALTGNDAAQQIHEFNRCSPQPVDGLVLTKLDTVDGKVGAALSLTFHTGIPTLFIGAGQSYKDLHTCESHVQFLARCLMR